MRTLILAAAITLATATAPWVAKSPAASSSGGSAAAHAAPVPTLARSADSAPFAEDAARANEVLDGLQSTYRLLDGVTVTIGATPDGHQAVSYYTRGTIVVSPTHSASITDILEHEIWHVIDWRDNGSIDWGESLPPDDTSDYLR